MIVDNVLYSYSKYLIAWCGLTAIIDKWFLFIIDNNAGIWSIASGTIPFITFLIWIIKALVYRAFYTQSRPSYR